MLDDNLYVKELFCAQIESAVSGTNEILTSDCDKYAIVTQEEQFMHKLNTNRVIQKDTKVANMATAAPKNTCGAYEESVSAVS